MILLLMSLKVIPLVIKSLMFAAMVDLMSINGEPVKKATGNYSAVAARRGRKPQTITNKILSK